MTELDIDAIEARANAARPGPWVWRGYAAGRRPRVALRSLAEGRYEVIEPRRWGFSGAQIALTDHATGLMVDLTQPGMLRFDVCSEARTIDDPRLYRHDFVGVNHPDAEFIAHARQDIPALIARVRELEAALIAEAKAGGADR